MTTHGVILYNVMLSNAKHLEVCTTTHRLRDLEILHFVQNDIVGVQNDIVGVQNDIESIITNC